MIRNLQELSLQNLTTKENAQGLDEKLYKLIPETIKLLLRIETDAFYDLIEKLDQTQLKKIADFIYTETIRHTGLDITRFGINFLTGIPFEGILSQGFRSGSEMKIDYWNMEAGGERVTIADLMLTMANYFSTPSCAMIIDKHVVRSLNLNTVIAEYSCKNGKKCTASRALFNRKDRAAFLPTALNLFPVGLDYNSAAYARAYFEAKISEKKYSKLIPRELLLKHKQVLDSLTNKRIAKTDIVFAAFRWAEFLGCWIGTTKNDIN